MITVLADPTHGCPGGCGVDVPHNLFACRDCWRRLPYPYRSMITTSYRRGDDERHARAMVNAMTWYRANPPDNTPRPRDTSN
ncbi:MAG TPA: hypothetical protein VFW65_31910 [Pseudonocardiaceae bacterium]|nr:hypothetical protein [Pseudonocardiaceae bacterium]